MYIVIGLFIVILSIIAVIIAGVYGVLADNKIKSTSGYNTDSNLQKAHTYVLTAYILEFVGLGLLLLLFVLGTYRYRHHFNSEDEVTAGAGHGFAALLAVITIVVLVLAAIFLFVAKNSYTQSSIDHIVLNYIDFSWYLTTVSFVLAGIAFAMVAVRLNVNTERWSRIGGCMTDCVKNEMSDCSWKSWCERSKMN